MNTSSLIKPVLLITSTILLTSGCVVREEVRYRNPPPPVIVSQPGVEVEVSGPPPAPVFETVVASPDPTLVWVPGAWLWERGWVWYPGHYDHPPRRGMRWVAPHYDGGRHVWVRGGWSR